MEWAHDETKIVKRLICGIPRGAGPNWHRHSDNCYWFDERREESE